MYRFSQLHQLLLEGQHFFQIFIVGILVLAWVLPSMLTPAQGVKHEGFKKVALSLLYAVPIVLLILICIIYFDFQLSFFGFNGSVAILICLDLFGVLHFMSLRKLGPFWMDKAAPKEDGQLVTTGLYRLVRHPIYSMFFFQGLMLCMLSPVSLIFGLGFIWIPIYRILIKKEEDLLIAKYGDAYRFYMKQTRYRIVPYIY